MIPHRMPFGKHKGMLLIDIPSDYLLWLRRACDLDGWLRAAVENEMDRRTCGRRATGQAHEAPPAKAGGQLVDMKAVFRSWLREMSLRWHPDRGGDDRTMQVVNDGAERLQRLLEAHSG